MDLFLYNETYQVWISAAYINQTDISPTRYMSLLGEQESSMIELLDEEFADDGRYAGIQNTVATTWLVSFLQIQQVDQVASDYLSFMACINPQDIPESILPATTSAKRKVEALGLLKAYSFISAQVDDSIFSLHRLVHLATRNWLRKRESLKIWVEIAADQLDKSVPNSVHDNRRQWRDYLPHALYLANSAEFQAYKDNRDDLLAKIGSCLQSDGRYSEAEILFRNVLAMRERACGPEDPDTLASISQLGSVLAQQGKYEEAEAMHRRDLAGSEKVLGPDHPDTLTSVSQLGSVLDDQGGYGEAEAMHRRAFHSREKVLGPEHPDTLTSVRHLGWVLARQGKYEEAEAMHQQALQGYKKVLGPEHPHTLTSVSQLGSVLARQGKYEEAEAMHRQALQGYEKVLGPEHPDTLTSMASLAGMYFDQVRLVEAEQLEVQVLESRKRILGPDHPETLTSMHNLAFTWKELGKVPSAFSLLKHCVALRNKVLRPDHPHATLSSNTLLGWETEASELSECYSQQASTDASTPPLVHT
ncbi:hypothetical protein BDV12DRAFT_204865 [Aspergillus spectabilis]